jgi:hypothetical protein
MAIYQKYLLFNVDCHMNSFPNLSTISIILVSSCRIMSVEGGSSMAVYTIGHELAWLLLDEVHDADSSETPMLLHIQDNTRK